MKFVTNHRDVIGLLPIKISDHIAVCKLQGNDEVSSFPIPWLFAFALALTQQLQLWTF